MRRRRDTVRSHGRCALPVVLAVALAVALAAPAQAAGLWVNEMGTPDLGTAAAGRAAMARDAATVFGNPAGMTSLDRSQVLVGLQAVYGDVQFDRDDNTTVAGGNGGNAAGWLPGGGLYGVHALGEKFRLGLWHGSYFGGDLDYDSSWSGRYYVTKDQLITLGLGINAAYRVNDWLSVGGGPFALYGDLDVRGKINNLDPRVGDGDYKAADSDVGFGGMAGIMLEPRAGTRIGATWISPVDLDFKDALSTSGLGPGASAIVDRLQLSQRKLDLGITVPQQVLVSVFQQLTPTVAVMGNVAWQDWSEFGKVDISIDGPDDNSATTNLDYDDTWSVALGVQYRFAPAWLWSLGGAYDSSPMSNSQRSPSLPLDGQWRLGTGIQHDLSQSITIGAAYELMYAGEGQLDVERGPLAGRLSGDYSTNMFHFFNVSLIWKF